MSYVQNELTQVFNDSFSKKQDWGLDEEKGSRVKDHLDSVLRHLDETQATTAEIVVLEKGKRQIAEDFPFLKLA